VKHNRQSQLAGVRRRRIDRREGQLWERRRKPAVQAGRAFKPWGESSTAIRQVVTRGSGAPNVRRCAR